jgi:hypothetical protein
MARRSRLKEDVTLGELMLLSHLSHLTYVEAVKSPAVELARREKISATVVRNVLSRISGVFGLIETEQGQRRTLRPNALGRSIGQAGFLCSRLCAVALDPRVDQAKLLAFINQIGCGVEEWHRSGKLHSSEFKSESGAEDRGKP